MESGINKKIKVVWLCHFSNQEMKDFFHLSRIHEIAPWISNLIELFQERDDIELHIVAPNLFTNKRREIKIKNIHYHFYQYTPYFIPKKVYRLSRFETRSNYFFVKKRIEKIIKNINPDIIHLHGAENPYYSAGILPLINQFPTFVTIQGFIRNASAFDFVTYKRIQIEEEILKKTKHFGVRTKEMSEISLKINPHAVLHFHNYPWKKPTYMKDSGIRSTFDIIFFAKVCKDKGIEDLLEALALVRKEKPEVSLYVVGSTNESYLQYLKKMIIQLNIRTNVKFMGFMESQQDIYKLAIHAKICVLPTYHDIIPGTILESMFIKLPVIAYAVGGIPELNDKGQSLVLVEKNNIQQLAIEIVTLLNEKSKRDSMAEYAFTYVQKRFNNSNVVDDILKAYNEILSS